MSIGNIFKFRVPKLVTSSLPVNVIIQGYLKNFQLGVERKFINLHIFIEKIVFLIIKGFLKILITKRAVEKLGILNLFVFFVKS